ncbi:MAG: hypothetical protein FJW39_30020 [Acidobacteria bacterium]|nr:hypothetical protein [Acidobacteriota bacterium]
MAFESEKTMFEVYRETVYGNQFRVVYFTELQDHNKASEINRAMAGEHYTDGFIRDLRKDDAKAIIDGLLSRMNDGEALAPEQFLAALGDHLA